MAQRIGASWRLRTEPRRRSGRRERSRLSPFAATSPGLTLERQAIGLFGAYRGGGRTMQRLDGAFDKSTLRLYNLNAYLIRCLMKPALAARPGREGCQRHARALPRRRRSSLRGPNSGATCDVASAIGATSATIIHHFGTKERLYGRVLERLVASLDEYEDQSRAARPRLSARCSSAFSTRSGPPALRTQH